MNRLPVNMVLEAAVRQPDVSGLSRAPAVANRSSIGPPGDQNGDVDGCFFRCCSPGASPPNRSFPRLAGILLICCLGLTGVARAEAASSAGGCDLIRTIAESEARSSGCGDLSDRHGARIKDAFGGAFETIASFAAAGFNGRSGSDRSHAYGAPIPPGLVVARVDPHLGTVTTGDDDTEVAIPDANLHSVLEQALGKESESTITRADMVTLTTLRSDGAGIADLTGLEFAVNLTELVFFRDAITDISPLSGLNGLTVLVLWQSSITDISPISNLAELTLLDLAHNPITDIGALSSLTSLEWLDLSDNSIVDVDTLSTLSGLKYLDLAGNSLEDVGSLVKLGNLVDLNVDRNPLSDASVAVHVPALRAAGVNVAWVAAAVQRMVPLFPSASEPLREGFARVINHSAKPGEVSIDPVDDEGVRYDTITLSINANETVHFNSEDLEMGNPDKGLSGSTEGSGTGAWRLELSSELDIEALAYIRTEDGFLTSMHDVAPGAGKFRRVAIFNPGSNRDQVSSLRLINPGDESAEVTITGVDDQGTSPGSDVTVTVPAGASKTLTTQELEAGDEQFEGALGDGGGKWQLMVESSRPVVAMSLLESPTDHLTNLSTVPVRPDDGIHPVSLFPAAGDESGRQGFVRVINRSERMGEVRIAAFDDAERDYGTVTLSVGANETVHFNSDDLEQGNAGKGLSGGVGAGDGDWRLELTSELDIQVLSYIRTDDGFLTAMHDVVPSAQGEHRVAVFNPGKNMNQVSLLRLINPGDEPAEVAIAGMDDQGASPGSGVMVTVPAGSSKTLTAQQLEAGAEDFEGALGVGVGKWRLIVKSSRPVAVMSLLRSPTGHMTNLSTVPMRSADEAAPIETAQAVFQTHISGPIVQSKCVNCHVTEGLSAGTRLVFVPSTQADHEATNLRVFKDFLTEVDGGMSLILNKIQGMSHGGGVQVEAGTEDYANMARFLGLLGEEIDTGALAP